MWKDGIGIVDVNVWCGVEGDVLAPCGTHGESLQDTVAKSTVKIVEPLLGGGGESVRSEKSSGKSLITTDSVRETTKLEVDSLQVGVRLFTCSWLSTKRVRILC